MTTVYNLCKLLIDRGRTDASRTRWMSISPPTGSPRRSTRSWPGCWPRNSNQQQDRWIKGCESNE